MILHYVKPHELARLGDELTAAGVACLRLEGDYRDAEGDKGGEMVAEPIPNGIRITVDDNGGETTAAAVAAVVEAHDPRVAAAERTALTANAAAIHDRIEKALDGLEAAGRDWGTLSPAQKDAALMLSVRMSARLARLALRRYDAPE